MSKCCMGLGNTIGYKSRTKLRIAHSDLGMDVIYDVHHTACLDVCTGLALFLTIRPMAVACTGVLSWIGAPLTPPNFLPFWKQSSFE